MRNLNEPVQNKSWFDKIVASKTDPAISLHLLTLEPYIKKSYAQFCFKARNSRIGEFSTTSANTGDRQDLQDCYEQSAQVVKLKSYIRSKQEKHLRFECQYCMIGTSDTFDHYLPQTSFPEFSVLSNNLLPACDHCNRRKWQHYKNAAGERIILNFYYDAIPTQQFLFCNIKVNGGVPIAQFSYSNPNGISSAVYNHIVRHYQRLEVIDRIHSACDSKIETIGIELSGLLTTHTLATVSAFLLSQAAQLKNKYGNNYCWAILKESMANSPRYLRLIGFA